MPLINFEEHSHEISFEEQYFVKSIRGRRDDGHQILYLVEWEYYPCPEDFTWEPFDHFTGPTAIQMVENYENLYTMGIRDHIIYQ